jgi:prepilin-type N-terminal cleavage/methylation domain-containing protein
MRNFFGFTLLEVLIALVIFVLAAVVLGGAYLNVLISYQVAARGNGAAQDIAFVRQQLMTQTDLQTAENGGEITTADGRSIKWTATIEPTNTTDLFTVALTTVASTTALDQAQTATQTFMLLRPTWSQAADHTALRQAAAARILKMQGKQQ